MSICWRPDLEETLFDIGTLLVLSRSERWQDSLIECRLGKLLGQGQVDKDDPTSGIWMITAPKEEEKRFRALIDT